MRNKDNLQKGFTLIEVIITIAIMSILAAIAFVNWRSFSDMTNLGNTAKMIESKIKLAKSYTLSATNDINYGVHLETDSVTIFPADAAYVLGDPDNQVFPLTDGVEIYVGAGNDIIFSRLTGVTANAGTIGIRVKSDTSKTKIITINSQGQTGTDSFEASAASAILEDTTNNINARHLHFTLAGWNIQSKPPITQLIFRKIDNTLIVPGIDTASYFNAGLFDWNSTVTVDGVAQKLRIHTLDASGTTLCIIRDRMNNSKDLKISFYDSGAGIEKEIVSYVENSTNKTVTVTANTPTWVAEMIPQ